MAVGDAIEPTRSALSRRNAIKLGAAAGVGAAAWTGPKIGVFGASPAYAGMCSPGETKCGTLSAQNTDNANECDPYFRVSLSNVTVSLGGNVYTASTNGNNICINGTSLVSISGTGIATCRLFLQVYRGNPNSGNEVPIGEPIGGDVGAASVAIPEVFKPSGGQNFFVAARLCCSEDPDDCTISPSDPGALTP